MNPWDKRTQGTPTGKKETDQYEEETEQQRHYEDAHHRNGRGKRQFNSGSS